MSLKRFCFITELEANIIEKLLPGTLSQPISTLHIISALFFVFFLEIRIFLSFFLSIQEQGTGLSSGRLCVIH